MRSSSVGDCVKFMFVIMFIFLEEIISILKLYDLFDANFKMLERQNNRDETV